MDSLFLPIKVRTTEQLKPSEIVPTKIDENIKKKLVAKYEGVCGSFGYVHPGSLQIISRSAGVFQKAYFNGQLSFHVVCKFLACNPVQGMNLEGVVKNKNALGLLVETSIQHNNKEIPMMDAIIPYKTAGIQSEVDLNDYEIGDTIYFQVLGKRSEFNQKKLSVVAKGIRKPGTIENNALLRDTEQDDTNADEEEQDDIIDDYADDIQDENLMEGGANDSDEDELPKVQEDEDGNAIIKLPTLDNDDSDSDLEDDSDLDEEDLDDFDGEGDLGEDDLDDVEID